MLQRGFIPSFSEGIEKELAEFQGPAQPRKSSLLRDLRPFLWISIDNDDSRDLDQVTYAQGNTIYIAIADVDAIVKKGSKIDARAAHNTTSVYTPGRVFPMLPLELSNDLTSLNEKTDRCAIVVEMTVASDGRFELADIYPALIRNHGKLTYRGVSSCLEESICDPKLGPFRQQLVLQDQIAQKIQGFREREGALQFAEIRLEPVFEHGIPIRLEERKISRGHRLIENFMIAANVGVTRFFNERKRASLRRIVRTPKRWERIVILAKNLGTSLPEKPDAHALRAFLVKEQKAHAETFPELSLSIIKLLGRGEYVLGLPGQTHLGHFDLAEHDYAHTTAPNRRFPDLVMQRLLKSLLYGEHAPYTNDQLVAIAARCTEKETDADKVERQLMKCAAAMVMMKKMGHVFDAMVTGASSRGVWVRLAKPPVEGRLVHGAANFDVGDRLKVKLVHVDVVNGHIDFAAS